MAVPVYNICSLTDTPGTPRDFMADRLAHYLVEHQDLVFPHKHSFYHLVYFTKAGGSHSIDFIGFAAVAGQLYCMAPGQVHRWDFEGETDGFIVNFSEQYIQSLIANPRYLDQFGFFAGLAQQQVIDIPVEQQPAIVQLLETIIEEGNSDKEMKDDFTRAALLQLFISVSRISPSTVNHTTRNYNQVVFRNFQKLIEQHYKEKQLTRDYAAMLYITPNHLNALCKDMSGRPAGELIRDRVLLEAKRLLVNASQSIAEIAAELGFADNSYFSRYFKKYEGLTPEKFRQQLVKNK